MVVSETAVSELTVSKETILELNSIAMRFFDRTEEIASLREVLELSKSIAQFTVVTGRRRIGKTHLIWKAYEQEPILYFFVARKAESELCTEYLQEIESKLYLSNSTGLFDEKYGKNTQWEFSTSHPLG